MLGEIVMGRSDRSGALLAFSRPYSAKGLFDLELDRTLRLAQPMGSLYEAITRHLTSSEKLVRHSMLDDLRIGFSDAYYTSLEVLGQWDLELGGPGWYSLVARFKQLVVLWLEEDGVREMLGIPEKASFDKIGESPTYLDDEVERIDGFTYYVAPLISLTGFFADMVRLNGEPNEMTERWDNLNNVFVVGKNDSLLVTDNWDNLS